MGKIKNDLLKSLRLQKDKTQAQIAEALGVGRTTYTKIEKGVQDADTDIIVKLADFFNVTTDYLLGREVDVRPAELPPENKTSLTPSEETHIKKYRRLDTDGKERIDRQIDFELYEIERNAEKEEEHLA